MDHREVLQLNKIFELVYQEWYMHFRSAGMRMNRWSQIDDDISTFMSKFCGHFPDEIYMLFLGKDATFANVIRMFKNHTIDRIRKEKGKKKIQSSPLYENTHVFEQSKSDHHDFEMEEVLHKYKKLVAKRFPKPDYILTFDMLAEGYSNKEIIKETGFTSSKVGSIKRRIQTHLRELNKAC